MPGIRIKVGASLDSNALRVFDPLEKRAAQAGKTIQKALNGSGGGDGAVRAAASTGAKLDRELQRAAAKILKEEEKAEKARTRLAEREAKRRGDIVRTSSLMAGRDAAKAAAIEIREAEKAANAQVRAAEKAAAGQARAAEKGAAAQARAAQQAAAAEVRAAEKAAVAAERAASRQSRHGGAIGIGRRAAISTSRAAAVSFGLGGGLIAGGVEMMAHIAEGMGLDLSVASHMANAQETQQRLVDVTNAGYIQGAAGAQGVKQNAGDVRKDVYGAADAGGFAINDVAEGLQKFVGLTGDLETGRTILKETAELARATGSEFGVMAEASAEVSNHLGNIPNKAAGVNRVMEIIAGQGKMGALEIKDFAKQMAKIAANAPKFEGKTTDTIGDLAILAQEAKMGGGAASASQAATAVLAFAGDFGKKTTFKHWQAAGLNPYTDDKHTTLRSPEELILEAVKYSKGDQLKLAQLFPSRAAARAVNSFSNIYAETKGSDSDKLHAVAAEFDRMRLAQLNAQEVQKAYTEAMGTGKTAAQLANNKLDEMAATIQSALVPALAAFAPALERLMPLFDQFAGGFANLINLVTGAAQKDAEDHAAAVDGKLSEDQKLLAGSTSVIHGAGGDITGYKGEVLDIIKAHGAKRGAAVAELGTQIADKEKEAERWDTLEKLDVGGFAAKAAHLAGTSSAGEMAAADRAEAQRMRVAQEKAAGEQSASNELLRNIYTAIQAGNAIEIRKPPPPTPPTGGVAPAESDGPNASY